MKTWVGQVETRHVCTFILEISLTLIGNWFVHKVINKRQVIE